jgi:hypothetical protein
MSDTEHTEATPPVSSFNDTLKRHGYALPQAILQAAALANHRSDQEWGTSMWQMEQTEFPVSVQGFDTRIDLVLRSFVRNGTQSALMACECKRANPAYSAWCFCKYRRFVNKATGAYDNFYAQQIHSPNQGSDGLFVASVPLTGIQSSAYHLGLETKVEAKGDPAPENDQIEKACTQVCRGVSGLVEHYASHPKLVDTPHTILPVIFTTANLWVSDVSLWEADLVTGHPPEVKELKAVDWVHYQYVMSPGLFYEHARHVEPKTLTDFFVTRALRTITIVHASKAETFFRTFNPFA